MDVQVNVDSLNNNNNKITDYVESYNIDVKEIKSLVDELDVYVDVKGSVKAPGVYKLTNKKIVMNAIESAGGLEEYADTTYINLSKKLVDEIALIWQGSDYDTFFREIVNFFNDIEKFKDSLESYQEFIKGYAMAIDTLDNSYGSKKIILK